jgi:general secretion pathway protein E
LYAGLSAINDGSKNILTIEDPVEYQLDNIGQTQVNVKAGMTFAKGLRSMLRQDPDVIMVGEIRDEETLRVAVQASLTGHLVLSTLHTNTAVGAITRLTDMGVEPYLISSTLTAVVAQRLVRLLCPHCKRSHQPTKAEFAFLGETLQNQQRIYSASETGCDECHQQGYKGRIALYEVIPITDELKQMIHDRLPESTLLQEARKNSKSIQHDGRLKVCAGLTSIEEVARVTG